MKGRESKTSNGQNPVNLIIQRANSTDSEKPSRLTEVKDASRLTERKEATTEKDSRGETTRE